MLYGFCQSNNRHPTSLVSSPISVCTPDLMTSQVLSHNADHANLLQSNSSMHHYECIALCRHQSPMRQILCQISSLTYPKIQQRQVIMNVLHPSCARPTGRWPPVLCRKFEDGIVSSAFSSIRARCPKKVRRRDLMMKAVAGW